MLQDQVIAEIKKISSENLNELYDIIHNFRLKINHEKYAKPKLTPLTFSQRWQGKFALSFEIHDERLDYLTQRYQL